MAEDQIPLLIFMKARMKVHFFLVIRIDCNLEKLWLSSFGSSRGTLTLDEGAAEAITKKGKSILPVGITKVEGKFHRGDLIICNNSIQRSLQRYK